MYVLFRVFGSKNNLIRRSKVHKEIYLSDFGEVALEKRKTVFRFKVW